MISYRDNYELENLFAFLSIWNDSLQIFSCQCRDYILLMSPNVDNSRQGSGSKLFLYTFSYYCKIGVEIYRENIICLVMRDLFYNDSNYEKIKSDVVFKYEYVS